jgi:predicted nucleotidyltransferase
MKTPDIVAYDLCEAKGCNLVYAIKAGSHLYGTNTPQSDEDFRGVFVPGVARMLGFEPIDVIPEPGDKISDDIVMHEIRKFALLCMAGNPNILDWLFAPEDCVIFISDHFEPLRENRELFLSRKLAERFYGYVRGHLTKMERGVTRHLGEKRKSDIEAHGYSTKNAMHLIRLARMGCEAIETGQYNVRRPDVEELLAIRRGEWDVEKIKEEGNKLMERMDAAVATSPLRDVPPFGFIQGLVIDALIKRVLISKRWKK